LRQTLIEELKNGSLSGEGPDGKLLVRIKEHTTGWELEHILCTLQHRPTTLLLDLTTEVVEILSKVYADLQSKDPRWCRPWKDIELLINPNGLLIEAGSDGDNGQTGRKLVMDYYGPRIPIGGGALSGKDLAHIDRAGAYAARRAALDAGLQWSTRQTEINLWMSAMRWKDGGNDGLQIHSDTPGSGRSTVGFVIWEILVRVTISLTRDCPGIWRNAWRDAEPELPQYAEAVSKPMP
jgi:hypothetical protein